VGGARPPPFTTFTITSKVAVYAPAEWTDTLTLFHLYQYMYSVLETPQSHPGPPPPNYNVTYPKDAPMRPVKISPVHKILLTGPWAECTVLYKVSVESYLYFHLLIRVCPKTIQVYMYGDENI
jgi:hypothetical protein